MWEARPAANAGCKPAQRPKLRPEVGPPTTAAKPNPTRKAHRLTLWEARPAANAGRRPAKTTSFAPRSGLPPQRQNPTPHVKHTALPHVGGAPRGECRMQACPKGQSFAPASGLSQQRQKTTPTREHTAFPCGRRAPAANAGCKPASTTRRRTKSGLPQRSSLYRVRIPPGSRT